MVRALIGCAADYIAPLPPRTVMRWNDAHGIKGADLLAIFGENRHHGLGYFDADCTLTRERFLPVPATSAYSLDRIDLSINRHWYTALKASLYTSYVDSTATIRAEATPLFLHMLGDCNMPRGAQTPPADSSVLHGIATVPSPARLADPRVAYELLEDARAIGEVADAGILHTWGAMKGLVDVEMGIIYAVQLSDHV